MVSAFAIWTLYVAGAATAIRLRHGADSLLRNSVGPVPPAAALSKPRYVRWRRLGGTGPGTPGPVVEGRRVTNRVGMHPSTMVRRSILRTIERLTISNPFAYQPSPGEPDSRECTSPDSRPFEHS